MLKAVDVNAFYGDIQALFNINIEVHEGELLSIVGANGAGKTTLINALSGTLNRTGNITFQGSPIDRLEAHEIASLGLVQVPEGRQLFPFMTVMENLELGAFGKRARDMRKENLEKVLTLMPKLSERADQLAGSLSGGEQQMCAIGRALMANPLAIMFDEPTLGLAPIMVDVVYDLLATIKKTGLTTILVEQNVNLALDISDRAYVLEGGNIILQGASHLLKNDERLIKAYLGG